jgi:CTP synthase
VPIRFHEQGVDDKIAELLNIWSRAPELTGWEQVVHRMKEPAGEVDIALVGKYVELVESYKSLNEALVHGGIANEVRVNLQHIDSEEIERKGTACLENVDGVLVAPGFGTRGTEGKIAAARFARENDIPYFGICLGLQIAVIEFARNVAGMKGANSTEFEPNPPTRSSTSSPSSGRSPRRGPPCASARTLRAQARAPGPRRYGAQENLRAAPPPLRGEQRLPRSPGREGPGHLGLVARPEAGGDGRAQGPPLLRRLPVPPEFKSRPQAAHPLFRSFVAAAVRARLERRRRPTPTQEEAVPHPLA